MGFEVDKLADIDKRLAAAGAWLRDDINDALGLGRGLPTHINAEVSTAL